MKDFSTLVNSEKILLYCSNRSKESEIISKLLYFADWLDPESVSIFANDKIVLEFKNIIRAKNAIRAKNVLWADVPVVESKKLKKENFDSIIVLSEKIRDYAELRDLGFDLKKVFFPLVLNNTGLLRRFFVTFLKKSKRSQRAS